MQIMSQNLPKKSKLLLNFSSCITWEEKYMYIIDLGKLLSKFPKNMRTQKYLISNCQSQTWIALIPGVANQFSFPHNCVQTIHLYGDSNALIVKGIIAIIFSIYQSLTFPEMLKFDITPILTQLQLKKNLTTSRSEGIHEILNSIKIQINDLNNKFFKYHNTS